MSIGMPCFTPAISLLGMKSHTRTDGIIASIPGKQRMSQSTLLLVCLWSQCSSRLHLHGQGTLGGPGRRRNMVVPLMPRRMIPPIGKQLLAAARWLRPRKCCPPRIQKNKNGSFHLQLWSCNLRSWLTLPRRQLIQQSRQRLRGLMYPPWRRMRPRSHCHSKIRRWHEPPPRPWLQHIQRPAVKKKTTDAPQLSVSFPQPLFTTSVPPTPVNTAYRQEWPKVPALNDVLTHSSSSEVGGPAFPPVRGIGPSCQAQCS